MSSALKPPLMAENPLQAFRLLVVSKEPAVLRSLATLAENSRWQVEIASSGWDAMERLESGAAPELLLLDLPRSDGDSFHMLRWLRRLSPELPVVAICDAGDTLVRQEAVRLGTERILSRPLDERQIQILMRSYGGGHESESAGLRNEQVELGQDAFFVSASLSMQKLRAQAELLAQSDVPVLIVGEPGSGKTAVGRLIHKLSRRSGSRFQRINCAGLSDHPLEDRELGSGYGSASTSPGTRIDRGTVFFAEIAAMPPHLQVKLLEAIDVLEAEKNADSETSQSGYSRRTKVRILSATSENLESALAEGRLSANLYRRLSAFTLQVPPLRQRREEIPILLHYAMRKIANHYGLAEREFSAATLTACQEYGWPGNVTELEDFVKRYLACGETELPGILRSDSAMRAGQAAGNASNLPDESFDRNFDRNLDRSLVFSGALESSVTEERENGDSLSTVAPGGKAPQSLKSLIQDIKSEAERKAIGAALLRTGWNRKAAARLLRVSYRTLLYKIEQYQMKAEPFFSSAPIEGLADETGGKRNGKAS